MREKFLQAKDPRLFYAHVQALLSENEPESWNVRMLEPTKSDEEIAEQMAAFFNGISQEYQPLDLISTPKTFNQELPTLSEQEVTKKILNMKKKTSNVPGDISGQLYDEKNMKFLAAPITAIFNRITSSKVWPKLWKTEHVTIIPKVNNPTEAGECRNISCTNFLSKVYESFVLEWARDQVVPKKTNLEESPDAELSISS